MPYRLDLRNPPDDAFDRLVALGALDVETVEGGIAAIMPDHVAADSVSNALGAVGHATPALGRDDGSVWLLRPHTVTVGRLEIIPADQPARAGALRMIDGQAFGTGFHPSTALCLQALDAELSASSPARVLDVGTGSGILALAALTAGVPYVLGIDLDRVAIDVAAQNARLNGLTSRLALVHGGPDALAGAWPLVLANVLAAPLMKMAPVLSRRVERSGRLVLSGIRSTISRDVEQAYVRVGMRAVSAQTRDGWTALTLHASW